MFKHQKKNSKIAQKIVIILLIGILIITLPEGLKIVKTSLASTSTHTTDSDFNAGILENVEVVGSNEDAYMRLQLTDDGSYASGFNLNGIVQTNPSTSSDYAYDIAVDTKHIYVAGYDREPGNYQWRVEKRDKTTGELDPSFDSDGIILSDPSTSNDQAYTVAIDTNYMYVGGLDSSLGNNQWRIEKRDKITGELVTAFDSDGVVVNNPSTSFDGVRATALDSSYIYAAGYDNSPGNYQWRIEKRDKITGALITTFDSDGAVESNPSTTTDMALSIAVDSSYIYTAGYDGSQGNNQQRVEKRDKITGALVKAFDSDGVVEVNPSTGADVAYSIAVDSSYIYFAGYDFSSSDYKWRIEKRDKTTGALITAFDTDGIVTSNPSVNLDYATTITIDTDNIYVGGYDSLPGNHQWRIEKRDITTGALVTTFDTDGAVQNNPSSSSDDIFSIVVDSGYIYAAGFDYVPGNSQWRVEKRYIFSGALVTEFDTDGVIVNNPSSGADRSYAIAVDSDYIYAAGLDSIPGNYQWRAEKRDKITGALETGFDSDGIVQSNPSSNNDYIFAMAIDSDYIYLGGSDFSLGVTNGQWRLEKRDIITGKLVTAFDTDGIVLSNPSSNTDVIMALTIDSSYIYLTGYDGTLGNYQWRIEKRDITTGALVTAFDSDGIITHNPSTGTDLPYSITLDDNYLYISGVDYVPGNTQWRVEKRDINTGSYVTGFGTSGYVQSNPGTGNDYAYALAVDPNYLYLSGYDHNSGNNQWRLEKLDILTGALITEFDSDGVVESNPTSAGNDQVDCMAIDSDYIYVGGYDEYRGNLQWRVEKRDIISGALVDTFGIDGVIQSNPSTNPDYLEDIALDSSYIYVTGHDYSPLNDQWRLEKYKNHVYPDNGIFTSPIIDASSEDNVVWSTISWNSETMPPETTVKIQLAANNDGTTWDYVGPDGTEYTYYETAAGQPIWSGMSGRYMTYRAYFETTDSGYTPILNDVTITYDILEVEPPVVTVTSPNGGEDWMKGEYYMLTWNAEGELGEAPVTLYYSTNNGDSWTLIGTDEDNDGIYNWTVPSINTATAAIRVDVVDIYGNTGTDTSDASFAIDPPPSSWPGTGGIGIDTTPPEISHTSPTSLEGGKIQSIIVDVQDEKGVDTVNLYYRYSATESYLQVIMGSNGEQYIASYEIENIDGTMYYYIEASDGTNSVTSQEFSVPVKATESEPSTQDDTDAQDDDEPYEFTGSSILYMVLVMLVVVVIFILIPKLYFQKPPVQNNKKTKQKLNKK